MKIEYCSIGHVALDVIGQQQQSGGSVLFGAQLASNLGYKTAGVTSSDVRFPFSDYPNIDWSIQFSTRTTQFIHTYQGDQRLSFLKDRADTILESSIVKAVRNSKVVMLAPILDEITPQAISHFSTPWIGLTPQGWFRKTDEAGNISFAKSIFQSLPKKIKLIVVSQDDIANDPSAWDWVKKFSEVSVCTMGKYGYRLSFGNIEKQFAPIEVVKEKNPTGCGDIFSTSALLLMSIGFEPIKACEIAGQAAAISSLQDDVLQSASASAKYLLPYFTQKQSFEDA